ncbi:B3/B4 domain-containing protein [Glutamicibacter halophytocola]|uniref:Phenylalanine--tRNA ligase beta subunit-related protein n=1 Tax=Glutamicibacter halophytocola TaxID=1933880 RepID=A0AA95BRN9_9MICC|nr:phenylalanine--tRNA ligase beta subunit-related protein [Glutamicibacter halophytocola]UUX58737.1 phenylalanine--tRNA ligase beta subunit-related protein [Glutamicibacter halophytocola]
MPNNLTPTEFLYGCSIDPAVLELRPDYRALLLVVEGINPQADARIADELIGQAEAHAAALLASTTVDQLPQIDAWREAYRAFGAKPQRTRNSLEALTRRASSGLPRVNALTDIYNAISVVHQIPIGGEDFDLYDGPALLTRASGDEAFDTVADGEPTIENPDAGEVIWRDGTGVTCRRWNWRQGRRTALSENTTTAFFILDALAPMSDTQLEAAGEALGQAMQSLGAAVQVSQRIAGAQ